MNEKLSTFLNDVCTCINCQAVHEDIRQELECHIEDLKSEYMEQGHNDKKALEMAIIAMGDSKEIGNSLNRQHKPQTEWILIGLTSIIAAVGGIIMYASSKSDAVQVVNFGGYTFYALLGLGVMIGFYFFDYTKLKKIAIPFCLVAFSLLIFALLTGSEATGMKYLTIGHISITSELITPLFLIAFAGFVEKGRGRGGAAIAGLLVFVAISVIPVLILPSLSQVIILLTGYTVLMISAVMKNHFGGNRKIQLMSLSTIGIAGISIFMLFSTLAPNRFEHIMSFLMGKTPSSDGWKQAMITDKWIAELNWFGKADAALDMGMPGITTDYVLINMFVTLGRAVGIAFIIIVATFIVRTFMTTRKIKNGYGYYLSLTASAALFVQFAISILRNFNFLAELDMCLPFISYGGTGYVISMGLVGIILSVWRTNNLLGLSSKMTISS